MKHTEGKVKIDVDRIHNGHVDIAVMARYRNFKPINTDEVSANAERIAALWNAADGMTNEEAMRGLKIFKGFSQQLRSDITNDEFILTMKLLTTIAIAAGGYKKTIKYLEHGREMIERLKHHCDLCQLGLEDGEKDDMCKDTCPTFNLLKKMEG